MKTLICEIGIIDKNENKHPVYFKRGLNVVTGRSSTGKSALIEIFDYCFGSGENTVPKGVITDNAKFYYVVLEIEDKPVVIGRDPDLPKKAFFRRLEKYTQDYIHSSFFEDQYFIALNDFKKFLREFFIDINDVDDSLFAKANKRFEAKAPTPSIRSLSSFMLQHQNLIANKHALFYRFDEKEKREQAIEHTKIFLGLVDQEFYLLSQEQERINAEVNILKREQEASKKAAQNNEEKIAPVLSDLYAKMGFDSPPLKIETLIRNPIDSKEQLDEIIIPEKIDYNSDAVIKRYTQLTNKRSSLTAKLRTLQREAVSIDKHIKSEEQLVKNVKSFDLPNTVNISTTVCPFCHTSNDILTESAEKLKKAMSKVSSNLAQTHSTKAKFESLLLKVSRKVEVINLDINKLNQQIEEVEKAEEQLRKAKSVYESVIMSKARLFSMLDTLAMANDIELERRLKLLTKELNAIKSKLKKYDIKKGLNRASEIVHDYMVEIGNKFEFEESYKPINLHFSFETFDLYHLSPRGEKIYLRSMGSGANWLYCHVTLFLALHRYFAELKNECAIPSIIFFDQPTQVYFPNFRRDNSDSFQEQKDQEKSLRIKGAEEIGEGDVDADVVAVENLFSQLSIYCNSIEEHNGYSPQIIVTDHADDLKLSDGVAFESLVNGNRWRDRGLIHPVAISYFSTDSLF